MNSTVKKYKQPIVLLFVTVLFAVLTYVVDRKPIGYDGTSIGFSSINGLFAKSFGYNAGMDLASDIAMYLSFVVVAVFAVIGVMQLVKGKSLSKVSKVILGLGIIYVIVAVLYVAFDKIPINYRPILQPGETEIETSFPSTHTLVICTVMGSALIACKKLIKDEKIMRVVKILATAVMVIGVCARLFSGVHWLTDIVAGILFSVTLVSLYTAWIAD
ncbi:phosphatase PAP2 family protein [Butyrivibrio sp. CB08]|uniref:phosphatase PAP2 family protein n=1 Tax=Butyrivibrio sp. CB08 TaxID=2364879 RepID=UPI000EA9FBAA|nr:phosphatase PAP2 family protein [Butyrivibrio sp. CB08]RKM59913.1 phosphatase PAP2 family protein [Butyrivibrio sp. CB08]